MKKSMSLFPLLIVIYLIMVVLFVVLSYGVSDQINEGIESKEDKIGNTVVINKDTLLIMDYSFLNDNYILSDGREISPKLLEKWKNQKK